MPPLQFRRSLSVAFAAVVAAMLPLSLTAQITGNGTNPFYTTQSIVNGATQTLEALAPNAVATLYGTNLAFSVRAVDSTDVVGGVLPTVLDGVGVWINGIPCSLLLISPTQINFLVPYQLTAGAVSLIVARDSQAGPTVNITLNSTSPGFFVCKVNNVVAAHLNGQVITADLPAMPGETIVIFAGGLGRTAPDARGGQLATAAFPLYYFSQLQVLLNGTPTAPGSILYAGLAPGFAGLYQINLKLPADLAGNPEIRVAVGTQISPPAVILPAQAAPTAAQ
jgi:uncharacterized protein (TIGR03437 family)